MARTQMSTPVSATKIRAFLASLDRAELPIAPQQYVDIYRLLMELADQNEWPADIEGLRDLLAPIVCSSVVDQQYFSACIFRWFAETHTGEIPGPDTAGLAERPATSESMGRGLSLFSVIGCIFVVMLLSRSTQKEVLPVREYKVYGTVQSIAATHIENAQIQYLGQITESAKSGNFSFPLDPEALPFHILIYKPGYRPKLVRAIALGQIFVSLTPDLGGPSTLKVIDLPITPPGAVHSGKTTMQKIVVYGLWTVGIGLTLSALFILYRWRIKLRRWATMLEPRSQSLSRKTHERGIYVGQRVREIATDLLRQQAEPTQGLDTHATVIATAEQGGLFAPVYNKSRAGAGYVFLVHSYTTRDHQAELFDLLRDRLTDWDISIGSYYYLSSFNFCHSERATKYGPGQYLSLENLATIENSRSLLIFGDLAHLINPLSNDIAPWARALQVWPAVAVFDSSGSQDTSRGYQLLSDLGICVANAGLEGLRVATESFATGRLPNAVETGHLNDPFPSLLSKFPYRWLEHRAPSTPVVSELLAQLRIYLSSTGMLCLKACAAYPALFWDLTLHFVTTIVPVADRENTIERLVALPWFRYSQMPDWLRVHLLSELSENESAYVRKVLDQFLETLLSDRARILRKEIIKPSLVTGLTTPLQDYIFASFLLGRKFDPLSHTVPKAVGRRLIHQGYVGATLCALAIDKIKNRLDWIIYQITLWLRPAWPTNAIDSDLVEFGDRQSLRKFSAMVAVLFMLMVCYALLKFTSIEYGYRNEEKKAELSRLVELNRTLQLEAAALRDPGRIDALSRQMGLEPPRPGMVRSLTSNESDKAENRLLLSILLIAQSQVDEAPPESSFASWCIAVANEVDKGNIQREAGNLSSGKTIRELRQIVRPGIAFIEGDKSGIIKAVENDNITAIAGEAGLSKVQVISLTFRTRHIIFMNPLNGDRYFRK